MFGLHLIILLLRCSAEDAHSAITNHYLITVDVKLRGFADLPMTVFDKRNNKIRTVD